MSLAEGWEGRVRESLFVDSDRYERLEKLGSGGMAVVYRALDHKLKREVALKQLRDGLHFEAEAIARLRREAEAVARVQHPNVVAFYDAVEESHGCSLVMELVKGEPLGELLRERRLELRAAVSIIEKVARGIHHAHQQGVVHRDLKPSNILVSEEGEPKIADFGVAQLASGGTTLTRTGALLGTPLYMAPEQTRGPLGTVDARTDVYALGVVLYEIATGAPPFAGASVGELVARIMEEEPIPPRRIAPGCPRDLETIVLAAIEKEPSRRYPSAEELANDLARFLANEPISRRPAGPLSRAARRIAKNVKLSLALLALLLLAGASAAALVVQSEAVTRRERVRVQDERRRAVEDVIASVTTGESAHRRALFQLGGWKDETTVALLASTLDGVTRTLHEARRSVYADAAVPTELEAKSGQQKLEGVLEALARADAGAVTSADAALLERVEDRAVARALRDVPADVRKGTLRTIQIAARVQGERLGSEGAARARLACEALGLVGIRERAVPALVRYLLAECDESRAAHAGSALVRLGGEDALRAVHLMHKRYGNLAGDFWREVGRSMALAPDTERAPSTEAVSVRAASPVESGLTKEAKGDFDGAVAEYARAIALDPKSAEPLLRRGLALNKKREFDAAKADFDRALAIDPKSAGAYNGRGVARSSLGDLRGGIADCTSAIAIDPDEAAHWSERGVLRWKAKEREGAIADLSKAIELDPKRGPYLSNRGTMRVMLGQLELGIKDLTRATEVEPRDGKAWATLAMAYFQKRDWDPTIASATRGIEVDDKQFLAYLARSQALIEKGDLDRAAADAERAVALSGPGEDRGLLVRARIRTSRSDWKGAIADASKAIELKPRRGEAFKERATARCYSGDLEGALADANKAVEYIPQDPSAWDLRGGIRARRGEHPRAIKDHAKAVELSPENPFFVHNLGNSRLQAGDLDGAIADASRALELDPAFTAAFCTRGNAREKKGDAQGALEDLSKAVALDPHRVEYRCDRARLLEGAGDLPAALADWTAGLDKEPTHLRALHGRGLLRVRLDDRAGARKDLERFLELAPPDEALRAEVESALGKL